MVKQMGYKEIIKKAELTEEFKEFKKKHPESYLVHIFEMSDATPQIGYYSKKTKMVTTFELGEQIKVNEESPFQEEEHDVKALEFDKISIDIDDAVKLANDVKKENYPQELTNKDIIILQNIKSGQMFNITFITQAFRTLNVKINAETGEVISHNLANLIGL
ncbi:MAG: hypothetical protein ABIG89_02145 [Candidatus Woesearchaeota archaeon]